MTKANESTTKKTGSKPAEKSNEAKPSSPSTATNSLALVLSIVAIAVSLYATYNHFQLNKRADDLSVKLLALDGNNRKISEQINQVADSFQGAQTQMKDKLNTLDKSYRATLKQQLYQSNDWMLLKARYYLQLAQINAHWTDNLNSTQVLLTQADELLSNIHDQRLFEVRKALAAEMAELKALPQLDTSGILSKLDAAQNTLLKAPIRQNLTEDTATSDDNDTKTPSAWRDRLKNSVNLLERLVIVRRHDEGIQPLLSAEQEAMLRESIRLNIQEAQLAVLQNNETVYKMALNQAVKSLNRNFTTSASSTKAVISQLEILKAIPIHQPKPNIESSLNLLNQLIESKDLKPLESPTTGENS
jgi:uroporphyrin-III C-methyltransferase